MALLFHYWTTTRPPLLFCAVCDIRGGTCIYDAVIIYTRSPTAQQPQLQPVTTLLNNTLNDDKFVDGCDDKRYPESAQISCEECWCWLFRVDYVKKCGLWRFSVEHAFNVTCI